MSLGEDEEEKKMFFFFRFFFKRIFFKHHDLFFRSFPFRFAPRGRVFLSLSLIFFLQRTDIRIGTQKRVKKTTKTL